MLDITKIIEPVKQLVEPFASTLSDGWAAVIGDRVALYRLTNAMKLQTRVIEESAKLGLTLDRSRIPDRYAFAWFEEATKQDEPEIQTLFARLLARAASGDENALDRRHLEIVSRFTPMDAQVFEALFGPKRIAGQPSWDEYDVWKALKEEIGEDAELSLGHLITLGVLERTYDISHDKGAYAPEDSWRMVAELEQTTMGTLLYRACAPIPEGPISE